VGLIPLLLLLLLLLLLQLALHFRTAVHASPIDLRSSILLWMTHFLRLCCHICGKVLAFADLQL